ncbi:MAG: hypothetical protein U1F43_14375 [Myxococcota bacterium]
MMSRALLLAAFVVAGLGQACTAIVGDSCTTQTDCGASMFCERSMPDGYCTLEGCTARACPDEGVCIEFDPDTSFCMASCSSNSDCRDGYTCVKDFGPHPFCNDKRGTTPSSE